MPRELHLKTGAFSKDAPAVKDVDPKGRTVTGYFSSFNTLDSDGDIIRPGAYAKTIREWGPDGANRIWHLDQHRVNQRVNKVSKLEEDASGLYFETVFPDTQLANDLLTLYACGAISEHSVGIMFMQASPIDLAVEGGGTTRAMEVTEVKMWEGSTVTWGANALTPATGIKAASSSQAVYTAAKDHVAILRSVLKEGVSDAMAERLELGLRVLEADLAAIAAAEKSAAEARGESGKAAATQSATDIEKSAPVPPEPRGDDAEAGELLKYFQSLTADSTSAHGSATA